MQPRPLVSAHGSSLLLLLAAALPACPDGSAMATATTGSSGSEGSSGASAASLTASSSGNTTHDPTTSSPGPTTTASSSGVTTDSTTGSTTDSTSSAITDSTTDFTTGSTTDSTSTTETTGDPCPDGALGCPCLPGQECLGVLVCEAGVCEEPDLATCGDGTLDPGEMCDAGPDNGPGQACKADCTLNVCGDGDPGPGELCDDGNAIDDDACSNACTLASCGDGKLQVGEECDDGDDDDTDLCTSTCTMAACGDEIVQPVLGENCDAGPNNGPGKACKANCTLNVCGDGDQGPGEACDDGNQVNNDGCSNACTVATCGDGMVQLGEGCDDGNMSNTDACTNACTLAVCGDGFIQPVNNENCDEGPNNGPGQVCKANCKLNFCGDGDKGPGEECDAGVNNGPGKQCKGDCKLNFCGDGDKGPGEACDDGNQVPGDGCENNCTITNAVCGNGVTEPPEQCDDGNFDNTDACTEMCKLAACGDGYKQGNEPCDDGNQIDGDGCNKDCVISGSEVWKVSLDGPASGADRAYGVTVDSKGDLIVVGTVTVAGQGKNVWISKRNPATGSDQGVGYWTRIETSEGAFDDVAYGVAVNSTDQVHVVGTFHSAVLPDDGPKAWVGKFQPFGNFIWSDFGDKDSAGYGIAVGPADEMYVAGETPVGTGNTFDSWARRINADGTVIWTEQWNFTGNCGAMFPNHREHSQSAVVYSGRVYLTGWWQSSLTCSYTDTNFSTIARTVTNGNIYANPDPCCTDWRTRGYSDDARAATLDSANNYIAVGRGKYDSSLSSNGALIVKYTPGLAGVSWWVRNSGDYRYYGVDTGAANAVIVAGYRTVNGQSDNFLVRKYTAAGQPLWESTYNGVANGSDIARAVAVDAAGYIYAVGYETVAGQGENILIRKLAP